MIHAQWDATCNKNIVCVDSYDDRIFQGRFYNSQCNVENFSSLTQLLICMERMLDKVQSPDPPDIPLAEASPPACANAGSSIIRRGIRATFELQVLFRQHTSWQGILKWREKNREHSFRSALELVLLMDSALASTEGGGSV